MAIGGGRATVDSVTAKGLTAIGRQPMRCATDARGPSRRIADREMRSRVCLRRAIVRRGVALGCDGPTLGRADLSV